MPNQNDPLLSLVSDDASSLDREKIASFLKPFITFDKETKEIVFSSQFRELKDNMKKIEIVLLASKVKSLIFEEEEGLLPKEIIFLEIMPLGSAKTAIKKLSDNGRIKKNGKKYYLPNYHITKIITVTNNK